MKYCNSIGLISDYSAEEDWRLQWGLDQNSIAVFFRNELIAIMPEWSGYEGFYGYSAGTNEETEIAWPLLPNNEQIDRFEKEAYFLDSWDDNTWPNFQSRILSVYDRYAINNNRYFAADDGRWPPLALPID